MSKTSKTIPASGKATIVFFGNERLATGVTTTAPTLQALIDAGYTVAAVVSNYERGTSRKARELEIAEVAKQHNIPLLLPDKPNLIQDELQSFGAEIGVLVAYGKIVPQSIIDIFPKGIVNIHPSLLPMHRGPIPLESVILNGEEKTGVSIMALAKEMDAGPVYGQSEVVLTGHETKQQLADELLDLGKTMLIDLLPGILDGSVVSIPQNSNDATYDQLISKDQGMIDWSKPAEVIEREIRAYLEWPKSRTELAGKELVITQAHVTQEITLEVGRAEIQDKQLVVGTSDGTLVIETVKPAGKGEMSAPAFIAGYGQLFADK